jgi:hypothetical protein
LADPGLQQTADSNRYFVDLSANQNQAAKLSNSIPIYRNIIDGMVFASNPILYTGMMVLQAMDA